MSYAANSRAPKDNTEIQEAPGQITNDSLAAESLRGSGAFADGSTAPSSVPSKSTTANNTDTSGATVLSSAPDAEARTAGVSAYRTPADEARMSDPTAAPKAYDTSKGGPQESDMGTAASYSAVSGGYVPEGAKPKGSGVTEGGFDSNAPNASFNSDIGTKQDPGRLAEERFAKTNARAGFDAGYDGAGQEQGADAGGGKGGFENLEETSA